MCVWIDGKRVIDDWRGHLPTRVDAMVKLSTKSVPIRVEYFETGWSAIASLRWTPPGSSVEQVVPRECLFQANPGTSGGHAGSKPAAAPEPEKTEAEVNPLKLAAREALSLRQHAAVVTRLAFHPTLPMLASAGKDGQALLWDLQNGGRHLQLHKFGEDLSGPGVPGEKGKKSKSVLPMVGN